MTDLASLFGIVGTVAFVVAPAILLTRWLAGGDGPCLAELFRIPLDPPWPRGVQEEEPVRWRIELLGSATIARRVSALSPTRPGDLVGWGGRMPGAIQTGACREP